MLQKHILYCLLLSLFFFPFTLNAQSLKPHILIAKKCLIEESRFQYHLLSEKNNFVLIKANSDALKQLIKAKAEQKTPCGGFIDVTTEWSKFKNKSNPFLFLLEQTSPMQTKFSYTAPEHEKEVNELIKNLNPQALLNNLTYLSNFRDRHANSNTGVQTAEWFKSQMEILARNNNRNDVTVYFIPTGNRYKQPSVVAKVGTGSEAGVVIGAHMDTLDGRMSKKPGADDDGTGSVTVLETARLIIESNLKFKKPLYFVWYAAEEEGLVGSNYVVSYFKTKNIAVKAVLNFDMTGYTYRNDPSVWLITDYVNKDLTTYLETLIKAYVKQPIKYTRCGYACSDHASWHRNGFAAAIPAETAFNNSNPSIHTSGDTLDKLLISHMTDYAKLSIAFAVELAEPV